MFDLASFLTSLFAVLNPLWALILQTFRSFFGTVGVLVLLVATGCMATGTGSVGVGGFTLATETHDIRLDPTKPMAFNVKGELPWLDDFLAEAEEAVE